MASPSEIVQLLTAPQATAAVVAAIELDLFAALVAPGSAAEVALRIGCPERTTRALLAALQALRLVERDGKRYRLSPLAAAHLVPGEPGYLGDAAAVFCDPVTWASLRRLAETVRAGGAVRDDRPAETPGHPFWNTFARAVSLAAPSANVLADLLAPWIASRPAPVRVLDLACGSGLYGLTLARRFPSLRVTALDWPGVLDEARATARRLAVEDRVDWIAGDAFAAPLAGPHDLAIVSHLLHHFNLADAARLVARVAQSLAPDGRIVVHEFVLDEESPAAGPAFFSILMLTFTSEGQSYTRADYARLLAYAGFAPPTAVPNPASPTEFLIADRQT